MKIKSATLLLSALLAGLVNCGGSQQATTPTSLDDDPHRCAEGNAASCQRLELQPNYRNFQSLFILELGCQKAVTAEAKQQICQQALHLATVELQDSNPDRVKGIATNGCTSGSQACCDWLEDSNNTTGVVVGGFGVGSGTLKETKVGRVSSAQALSVDEVRKLQVHRAAQTLKDCMDSHSSAIPTVAIHWRILPNGSVQEVTVTGSTIAALDSCLIAKVKQWTFTPGLRAVDVVLPLVISPE
jgi:hypothetical protein